MAKLGRTFTGPLRNKGDGLTAMDGIKSFAIKALPWCDALEKRASA
jgi:hypothetical protein